MSDFLPSIDLEIAKKLRDRGYRRKFFLAETSAQIAAQLIALRKRRSLSQKAVADLIRTGQPAISRVEQADYRNWSFNTLRKLVEAMDARLRVIIEPAEDVLVEYEVEPDAEREPVEADSAYESAANDPWPEQRLPMPQIPDSDGRFPLQKSSDGIP